MYRNTLHWLLLLLWCANKNLFFYLFYCMLLLLSYLSDSHSSNLAQISDFGNCHLMVDPTQFIVQIMALAVYCIGLKIVGWSCQNYLASVLTGFYWSIENFFYGRYAIVVSFLLLLCQWVQHLLAASVSLCATLFFTSLKAQYCRTYFLYARVHQGCYFEVKKRLFLICCWNYLENC